VTAPRCPLTDEDIAYWCETVAEKADSQTTRDAIARLAEVKNPGLVLRVAADLWQDNPDPSSLRDLDELEYLEIVLAYPQVVGELPNDVDRVAREMRQSLLSRWSSRAEAATDLIENCLGEDWLANARIADRHRLTDDDIEQVERDATGANGVSIAETDDGWFLIIDCTV
jgi:hypothetical protein